jgi:hypothetical protein
MEVSSQLHALAPSPLGKELLVPIEWAGWAPSQSGCYGEEKNLMLLPGTELQSSSP